MSSQTQVQKQPEQEQVQAKIVLSNSREFKKICQFLENMVSDEITFNVDADGLHVAQMEPARATLTLLTIPKESCEEFDCVTPGRFAMDMTRLRERVLKRVNKDEKVDLVFKDGKARITLIHSLRRTFNMPLLEPDEDKPPVPKVGHLKNGFKIVTKKFKELLEDVMTISVKITLTEHSVTFADHGDGASDIMFSCTLKRYDDSILDIKCGEPDKNSFFSSQYLTAFSKYVLPLSEIVSCEYSHEMPMLIRGKLEFGMKLDFWMAPRIIEDEK